MRALLLILAMSLLSLNAGADKADEKTAKAMDNVRASLLAARPGLPISRIDASDIPGYYSVQIEGGMILYTHEDGGHFFAGDMFYVEPGGFVNATEKARSGERRELLESLDESQMLVYAPSKEKTRATITVFTDIDCGYCRKLHQEVPEMNRMGIAVRYLASPRAGVGSASYDKIVSAWCADNPELALTQAKSGQEIEQRTCSNPVAAQFALGGDFGVNGTPAIFFEDGTMQPGYLPAADMARKLGLN